MECKLKEKYYYCDSEYYIKGAVLVDILIEVSRAIFNSHVGFIVIGVFFVIMPLIYFLYCLYNSYKLGKVKLEIGDEDILIYRLYLLKPYRVKKEHVIEENIQENKRKTIIKFRTKKRKYTVKAYNI